MSKICPVCERVFEDEHIFCAADGTALRSQNADDDLIGNVIDDRYVITSLLGEGGMGRVYLGQHVHLPRKVAIKVLHEKLTSDPNAVARFNREATSACRIEHDNVARVFDFGRMESGATYLAMEYIPGRTLSAVLDQEGALPPARVVHIIDQVAAGLGAAHKLDIVHRDLKPDNVLIMRDADGEDCVKIVDFGIAKAIGFGDEGTLTAPGFVTGTPEYMSPEQLLGQDIDCRSDVFALGLLAFRALTNTLPFASPTPARGFAAVLGDQPRRLQEAAPTRRWPAEVQTVFDRVLARDLRTRYGSAAAFATALREAIARWEPPAGGGRFTPFSSTAVSEAPVTPSHGRRRLVPMVAGGVAVLAALGLILTRDRGAAPTDAMQAAPAGTTAAPRTGTTAPAAGTAATPPAVPPVVPAADNATIAPDIRVASAAPPLRTARPPVWSLDTAVRSAPSRAPRNLTLVSARMDSVRDALDALLLADETRETPARATALAARVDQLLPDAPSASDSARAYLLKANLLKLAGDRSRACATLGQARPLAVTTADRNSVKRNGELWGC